jgi:hypothetical protein
VSCIDVSDPRQVFNRLAQLQHDTSKRIRAIEGLTQAQTLADREFDQLGRLAIAYLAPTDYPVVTATAYDERHCVRHSFDYCLTIVNNSVFVKLHCSVSNVGELFEEQICAALSCPE